MTTKLIALAMILAVLYGGWELFFYWEKVKNEEFAQKKEAAAAEVTGDQLSGVPYPLLASLQKAEAQGATALGNWLKAYSQEIQDPRKAWIELDYCVLLSAENPAEARRLFAEVKARTPGDSPIWQRIHRLEKTYQ